MKQFAVAMITLDRSPKSNYLGTTLSNLERAGVFASPLLESFTLVDSGSTSKAFIHETIVSMSYRLHVKSAKRWPTENAACALRLASGAGAPWVLFLEDDIDVCDRFLESTSDWLADFAYGYRIFPLGANYASLQARRDAGHHTWTYPLDLFYGTLAVAMKAETAASLAAYLDAHFTDSKYDLLMADWARKQGVEDFLTPVPSFVQHIGVESLIRPGSAPIIYPCFAGRTWSYERATAKIA